MVTGTIFVLNGWSDPTLVSPADASSFTLTVPTVTARFDDPEGDTGQIDFEVCSIPLAAGPDCLSQGGTVPASGSTLPGIAAGTNGSWTPSSLPQGTWYWHARSVDQYGGTSGWTATRSFTYYTDVDPPVLSFGTWDELTNPAAMHRVGSTMFYNPLATATFRVTLGATDDDSGVASVTFPTPGTNWLPTADTPDSTDPYQQDFSFDPSSDVPPDPLFATALDNAGNSSTLAFSIVPDVAPPYDSTVTAPAGFTNVDPEVSFTTGSDDDSGIGTHRLLRAQSTYTPGTGCGSPGAYTQVGGIGETSPYTDTSTADGTCYFYQLRVGDNVGNFEIVDAAQTTIVDRIDPIGGIDPISSPTNATGITVTGSHDDTISGVDTFDVTFTGDDTGDVCLAQSQPSTWSCAWDTSALSGTFTLHLEVVDRAGNAITYTGPTVVIERGAPDVSITTWTELAPFTTTHPVGDTLYYRAGTTGSARLDVAASDPDTSVASVSFPEPGTNWTPTGGDLALASPYSTVVGFDPTSTTVSGPYTVTATDAAGNTATADAQLVEDSAGPTITSVSSTDGFTNAAPQVTFAPPTDTGSDVAGWIVERADATWTAGTGCGTFGSFGDVSGPSPTSPWTDGTAASGNCYRYQVVATDNVTNSTTVAATETAIFDFADPSGTIDTYPTATNLATVTLGGTLSDVDGNPASATVTYTGTSSGAACSIATGASPWSCDWNTSGLAQGTYTLTLHVTDEAGNTNTSAATAGPVFIDRTTPDISFTSWTEQSGTDAIHVDADTLYYRPGATATATLTMAASDLDTSVASVSFPEPGTNWTPAGGDLALASPYSTVVGFDPTSTTVSGPYTVTATDAAGNTATANALLYPDSTPPSIASASSTSGFTKTTPGVTFAQPTDSESGIAAWEIQRAESSWNAGTGCDPLGGYGTVQDGSPTSPWTDPSTTSGTCYSYRIVATDNVGNTGQVDTVDVAIVDRAEPTISFTVPPPAATGAPSVPLEVTHADVDGTVESITIDFSGPSTGTACSTTGPPTDPWSCTWDTSLLADGSYFLSAIATDAAGNTTSIPASAGPMLVDRDAPTVTFGSWTELSGTGDIHVDGDTLYYRPGTTGSARLHVDATDSASGVASVSFLQPGTNWGPAGGSVDSAAPWTADVSFDPTSGSTTGTQALATDAAGNSSTWSSVVPIVADSTPPSATFSSTTGFTNGNPTVTFTIGGDGGSGLAGWDIERAEATWSPVGGCAAFGTYSVVQGGSPTSPWTDTSTTSGKCYTYRAAPYDNVGNRLSQPSTDTAIVDRVAPGGTLDPVPATSNASPITLGGTYADTDGTIASGTVTFSGPTSGTACSFGSALPSPWSCDWNTAALADGSYTLSLTLTDEAGNPSTSSITAGPMLIDRAAPTASLVLAEAIPATGQHVDSIVPTRIWLDPAAGGSFRVDVTADDGTGSGVASTAFPGVDAGWSATPVLDTAAPWTTTYAYPAGGTTSPGLQSTTVSDAAGNSSTATFDVQYDSTGPTGGSISYPDGVGVVPTITFGAGTDAGSGLDTWRIERRTVTTTGPTSCDTTSWAAAPWSTIATTPSSPYDDATIDRGACYQYRVVSVDNVGNETPFTAAATFITSPPAVVLSTTSTTATEGGATGSFTVSLQAAPTSNVTVSVTGDARFTTAPTTLTFTTGNWATAQAVVVTAVDDQVDQVPDIANLAATLQVSSTDNGYDTLPDPTIDVAVVDDDTAGVVVVPSAGITVREGDAAQSYSLSLSTKPAGTVVLTPGVDASQAQVSPTTITFDPTTWNTPQQVTVTAVDDALVEAAHTTAITHAIAAPSDAAYAALARPSVPLVVNDDDVAGLKIDGGTSLRVSEATGTPLSVRVSLTAQPTADTLITVAPAGGQLKVSPDTLTFSPADWNTTKVVSVTAVDDTLAEATPHPDQLRFTPSSADTNFAAVHPRTLSIGVTDDDPARFQQDGAAGWTLSDAGRLQLAEAGDVRATVRIRAVGDPSKALRIAPVVDDQVEVSPEYATIPAGSHDQPVTFTIRARADGFDEDDLHRSRLAWKVTTSDPLYADRGIAATGIDIADAGSTSATSTPSPPPPPPPADPTPPSEDPVEPTDPVQPDPSTDDGTTISDPGSTEDPAPPVEDDRSPRTEREDRPNVITRTASAVRDWAGDNPITATGAATATAAVAWAIGGKALGAAGASGGLHLPPGLSQLRRLLRRRQHSLLSRLLFLRRRRRRDDGHEHDLDELDLHDHRRPPYTTYDPYGSRFDDHAA